MKADLAALGVATLIFVALIMAGRHAQHPPMQSLRYCENTTGAWLTPDHSMWADPGFPDYLPCKLLKQEQDV